MYRQILDFWFVETEPRMWWSANPDFDNLIRERFLTLLERAARAELYSWRREPKGRLAEIILLDQFSRNLYRQTPAAFSQDSMALVLAQEAVAADALADLTATERSFLLMPYMHSESREIHRWAEQLFRDHTPPASYEFELRHKAIIDRFGRYPHRNQILGRVSSAEERDFLKQPGSGF
ncbi:DUF924 family protein [Desulfuromonas carbonis]|uniref:DUF924 family protein n=1 Tax=Desulfuromonas sp. DDH964 TaxID=1823759 RepID=UPI00078B3DE7|nr:DUF924 family protein [Desulfuromonas sp. DDH964]AMV72640.1 membrane protein [Desulfuromonas sp. DDH964]